MSTNLDLFKMAPGGNSAMIVPIYHVAVNDGNLTSTSARHRLRRDQRYPRDGGPVG